MQQEESQQRILEQLISQQQQQSQQSPNKSPQKNPIQTPELMTSIASQPLLPPEEDWISSALLVRKSSQVKKTNMNNEKTNM